MMPVLQPMFLDFSKESIAWSLKGGVFEDNRSNLSQICARKIKMNYKKKG